MPCINWVASTSSELSVFPAPPMNRHHIPSVPFDVSNHWSLLSNSVGADRRQTVPKLTQRMCLDPAAAVLKSLWQQLPSLPSEAADHLNEEERQQPPVVRKYLSKPFPKRVTLYLNYCSHWETLPEGKSATSFIFRLRAAEILNNEWIHIYIY